MFILNVNLVNSLKNDWLLDIDIWIEAAYVELNWKVPTPISKPPSDIFKLLDSLKPTNNGVLKIRGIVMEVDWLFIVAFNVALLADETHYKLIG